MLKYLKDYRIAWWAFFFTFTWAVMALEYHAKIERDFPKICWGVRYYKYDIDSCGTHTYLMNSTDEGYYYYTKEDAIEAGYSAAKSDTQVGYIYDKDHHVLVQAFKCLCNE